MFAHGEALNDRSVITVSAVVLKVVLKRTKGPYLYFEHVLKWRMYQR